MASIFKKAKDRSSKEKLRTTSGNSIFGSNDPLNPLNAPTEVAQATSFHRARNANELSFKRGDFFHVISAAPSQDGTIEIFDPVKNLKGRAPAACFKIFEKTHHAGSDSENRITGGSTSSGRVNSNSTANVVSNGSQFSQNEFPQPRHASTASSSSYSSYSNKKEPSLGNLFGVVLYDFHAERSDELSVSAGDSIFICAHHEYEWYIAKFLNKVGEVGLVPVSYVQLIDAVTRIPYKESPRSIIESENLPTVEEWKAIKNKHKASSRSVGGHDNTVPSNGAVSRKSSQGYNRSKSITKSPLNRHISDSLVLPINTNIESFSSTNNKFWFLIRVGMSDGSIRSLCRYYEDFFNFHQKLLSTWPLEGGKFDTKDKKERILPFIPGPVIDVTESLCHKRLIDLNEYLKILLQLPDYISKSNLVVSFFDLMDGDETSNNSLSKTSYMPVEPNRPAPNLKIINSDSSHRSSSTSTNQHHLSSQQPQQYQSQHPQQQQHQQQKNFQNSSQPTETLSQSHYDRKSQYEINNRSSSISNKVGDFTSTSKSSTASVVSQGAAISQTPPTSKNSSSLKLKLKFYYKDDIFALSVPNDIKLSVLKAMVVPKIDECDSPGVESKIEIYSKNSTNVDHSTFDKSQALRSDSDLWNDANFVDKGKFLIVVT